MNRRSTLAAIFTGLLFAGVVLGIRACSNSPAAAKTPLKVQSVTYLADTSIDRNFVFPGRAELSAAEVKRLNEVGGDVKAYEQWGVTSGGIPTGDVYLKILLANPGKEKVILTDLGITKECAAPATGTLVYSPVGGGPASNTFLLADLDDPAGSILQADTKQPYFGGGSEPGNTIVFEPNETVTLQFKAITATQSCRFSFTMTLLPGNDNTSYEQKLDDSGKPFVLTSVPQTANEVTDFTYYDAVYAGGVANGDQNGAFVPTDPKTYRGGRP